MLLFNTKGNESHACVITERQTVYPALLHKATMLLFLGYFKRMKVGLSNHQPVCLIVGFS
jgi:hypothetical protein